MSSGRLTLSARGREDLPITGSPSYSYYIKNYRRDEPFEYLIYDNNLNSIYQGRTPTYGDIINFRIPARGDLLSKVFLKIVLPPTYLYSNLVRNKTSTFDLFSIIEHVELVIGGQLIQRLTGEYILNHFNLYYSSNDLEYIKNTTEMKIFDLNKTYAEFGQFVMLPIPFYFYNRRGMEIPLRSLSRQHVQVNLKLTPRPPIVGFPDLSNASITAEYVLLGSDATRQLFLTNGIMYRVEQVQMNSTVASTSETKKVLDLDFQNPVRELFVCVQPQTYQDITNGKYYNFFGNYRNTSVNFRDETAGWYLSEHHITGMSLRFNNNEYINENGSGSAAYMSSVIPQKYYANSDNIQQYKGYIYPFVIDPLAFHPQGHINMSRILKKQMTLFMNPSQFVRSVRVYATSYNIMVIKDGIAGLMFTNPSYYNPKIVLGDETGNVTEGVVPTDLETLSEDQGYYYAVKVDDGHEIVGLQLFTEDSPEFTSDTTLQDNQFSYLLNTGDTFMSGVTTTNTSEYAPGTISQFVRSIAQVPNVEDGTVDTYGVTSTDNYIYTSNFGIVKSLRLSIKVHELTGTLGAGLRLSTLSNEQYSNLNNTAQVYLYRSRKFFGTPSVEEWLENADVDVRVIRGNAKLYESPGYYYAAEPIITDLLYSKMNFARTYDFAYVYSSSAESQDSFVDGISTVSYRISGLQGSGTIKTFLGSAVRGETVEFSEDDNEVTISFVESNIRKTHEYSVLIDISGENRVDRRFVMVSGGLAPPLYHAVEFLPPEGSTTNQFLIGVQGYSTTPNFELFSRNQLDDPSAQFSNIITLHTNETGLKQNIFSNIIFQQAYFDINGNFSTEKGDETYVKDEDLLIERVQMGENRLFYTTETRSVVYLTVAPAFRNTAPPTGSERIKIYSSSEEFDTSDVTTWKNAADIKEYTLNELTHGDEFTYYRRYRQVVGSISVATYNARVYRVPLDNTAPILTIRYQGSLVTSNVELERFLPLATFFNFEEDETYLNITTDDETAVITDSNNIVTDTVGFYTVTFTATDPFGNLAEETVNVDVVDTTAPQVVSNTFTGSGLSHTLNVTFNEECSNIDVKENGILKAIYNDVSSFSYTPPTDLTEGVLYTYTADVEDQYGNSGTVDLGNYTPDETPPDVFVYSYGGARVFNGSTVYLERYVPFGELINSATDNVDGEVDVAIAGTTPDSTEFAGTIFPRTYTAVDTAGNSNVVTINIEISDVGAPSITDLNAPTFNESTSEITITGDVSEEAYVNVYTDELKTALVASVLTTGVSNTFTATFTDTRQGKFKYYLLADDGVNISTSNYETSEVYISDSIFKFGYEGTSNTDVSVPAGKTNMYVFLWGANGGRGVSGGIPGGGGGFTESIISGITSGQTVTVNVGQKGNSATSIFGGGGVRSPNATITSDVGGGGMSNIIYNGYIAAVAGGGGGSRYGGGGGGLVGDDSSGGEGTGASQTSAGSGAETSVSHQSNGEDGGFLLGGNSNVSAVCTHSGGGGGGGYYGGGGGLCTTQNSYNSSVGGGGGSSWLGLDGATVLSDPSDEWGTSSTYADTGGRTWTAAGLTYTNSKMLRGSRGNLTKAGTDHFFYNASSGNGYVVIMFT